MFLLAPDNHMGVMAGLFAIAGAAFLLEKTRIGSQLTGAVIAILGAIVASNIGLIPHSAPAYDFVFTYFVPILIPLFLFKADLRRIFSEAGRMTAAFLLAATGTVAGVTIAALALDLSSLGAAADIAEAAREPAIAGLFTSTYIGGSVNYAALGELTGLKDDASFFSAATAADNLFSALYLMMLAVMPGWLWLAKRYVPHNEEPPVVAEVSAPASAMSLTLSLGLALLIVTVGDALMGYFDLAGWRYVIITSLALGFATLAPKWAGQLSGSFELGVGLSFVFFTAIAAGANIAAMIEVGPLLIALVTIILAVHAVITFGFGMLFKLSLPELIIASNAAVLGATTAPALAATKGWHNLVTPAVLVGVMGYALGTFIGTLVFKFWGAFL